MYISISHWPYPRAETTSYAKYSPSRARNVCYFKEKRIAFYDSLGGSGAIEMAHVEQYIEDEHADQHGADSTPLDMSAWTTESCRVPQQVNGYDCGVFMCQFIFALAMDTGFTFTQTDMPYFRRRMALDIAGLRLTFDGLLAFETSTLLAYGTTRTTRSEGRHGQNVTEEIVLADEYKTDTTDDDDEDDEEDDDEC